MILRLPSASGPLNNFDVRNGNAIEYIRSDPMPAPLRGDKRFEALAEKIVPAAEFKSATASK